MKNPPGIGRYGWMVAMVAALLTAGCENSKGGGGLNLKDIGDNNPDVVVCIGDSITEGVDGGGTPFPARLGGKIGKTVINAGHGGEPSLEGAGRVPGALRAYKPAAMTILYGANDLITDYDYSVTIDALRSMIQAAKANQTVPVLATLTPMIGLHGAWAGGVIALNTQIRALAAEEKVQLVDLEKEFGGTPEVFLISDGLHPNDLGNELIATAFAEVF